MGAVAITAGDIFLLCSDGLMEGLHDSHLEEFLRLPEAATASAKMADRLVEEALARNARDNVTALVIRVV